ncbi:hypothetical protein [Variovorax sp. PBL-E5]|uniref:hypothetical protein n=1 Tax=Variovorax sp. PBL-E5 TaxID=434014 RepID=UPI0013166D51|nr:hypothetical protein [Variovorax sp. PBL-E5]VTU28850.1 hypothetical protein E5CHR_02692 [Variovorax sp. PBL-E5]
MTPQSHFTVAAPIAPGREPGLRAMLDTMNTEPGVVDAANALLPFAAFERLHFARFAILDDMTMGDLEVFGLLRPVLPRYLSFMGDCDGPARAQLTELVQRAGEGLRRIFSHCEGFDAAGDLLGWLMAHDLPVATRYVNWIGRTVLQVHEEAALQRALSSRVPRPATGAAQADPQATRNALVAFVRAEQAAGRLALTPPEPTPPGWQLRNLLHLIGIPAIGLVLVVLAIVLLPLAIVLAVWAAVTLRRHERSDPEYCPRPDAAAVLAMQQLEDHDLSNSFTAVGAVKPGRFRRALVQLVLVLIDYAARHLFARGHLARVQTIHFARWVFLDDRTRMVFASSYDGSHESYMDDFINKAGWGLNLVFSNGFGWPRTAWLIKQGARHELRFKHYQRRHQVPTQVWYKAYPGLTLTDLDRNRRIRDGLERPAMSDAETLEWLGLL